MRILLVSHDFLPAHPAGTEIYTYQLGKRLQRRGHDVHVFTTEKDISLPNASVALREYGGLPVHELTNNLFYNDFDETWDFSPAARSFGLFLDDLKPDVVHFMHLMYLSVGCLEEVARRGLPVFYTLHDYWLQCPRFGQRVHADRSICHTIEFERCGTCLARFKYKQTRLERRVAKVVCDVRSAIGLDLGPVVRGAAARMQSLLGGGAAKQLAATTGENNGETPPAPQVLSELEQTMAAAAKRRDAALRRRILPVVDRFIAPSQFLRQSFVTWGIPAEQILYMRTGIDLERFQDFRSVPSERLRVGFIGTVVPHKGVHVLLRAWRRLPAEVRARVDLTVWGPTQHNPDYLRRVRELAEQAGARLAGPLAREEVPDALARTDLLVMPSVWYENSPLIILEALATRTPLLVSDLGGMAELVEHGRTGFHFRVGDDADLARVLGELLSEPERLKRLFPEGTSVREVEEDAEELEGLYRGALERRGRPA